MLIAAHDVVRLPFHRAFKIPIIGKVILNQRKPLYSRREDRKAGKVFPLFGQQSCTTSATWAESWVLSPAHGAQPPEPQSVQKSGIAEIPVSENLTAQPILIITRLQTILERFFSLSNRGLFLPLSRTCPGAWTVPTWRGETVSSCP